MKPGLLRWWIVGWIGLVAARADYVIVERVEGAGETGTTSLWLKGDKSRADLAPEISIISDGATGEVVTLAHPQKRFMRISASALRVLLEKRRQLEQAHAAPQPARKPVASGRREKVNQYDCQVYVWSGPGVSAKYWVARDFPDRVAIAAALERYSATGMAALSRGLAPSPGELPGMIIKTEMVIGGDTPTKVTSTLVAVYEESLAESLFVVPADYQETPSPQFELSADK